MKKNALKVLVLFMLFSGGIVYAETETETTATGTTETSANSGVTGVVCTMEAKLCPDGSYVGRSGPRCEFTPCPGSVKKPERPMPLPFPKPKDDLNAKKIGGQLIPTTTPKREDKVNMMKDRIQEKLDDRKASSTGPRGIGQVIKNFAKNRFEKMNFRFQATIERMETIMAKIVSRVEKVKEAGGNTTDAEKYVAEAKLHLDEAKTLLASINSTGELTSTQELNAKTPEERALAKDTFEKLRKTTAELEGHLRSAHKALENAVRSLKGSSSSLKPPAQTNTTEINTQN